jgi:hypothetical protein
MWHLFIHRFVFYLLKYYLRIKRVFNTWYSCAKYMNLQMNELHTIFIINSSHAKFVIVIGSIRFIV